MAANTKLLVPGEEEPAANTKLLVPGGGKPAAAEPINLGQQEVLPMSWQLEQYRMYEEVAGAEAVGVDPLPVAALEVRQEILEVEAAPAAVDSSPVAAQEEPREEEVMEAAQ